MRRILTAGLALLSLLGISSAQAAVGPVGTGIRVGLYLNDGTGFGLMADMPQARPIVPVPGREVFTLGIVAGDSSGAVLSLEHQFGTAGPYLGLGLAAVVGDDSGLGIKASVGLSMARGSYLQADFIGAGDGGVFLGIGKRF